ncbi:MAG: RsmE family RNA methyltransferase [Sandaracinaceae bacterium]
MNLLLLEPHELEADHAELRDGRAAHVLQVLALGAGDRLRVGLLDGPLGTAEIIHVAEGAVRLRCAWDDAIPDRARLSLLLALPRPKVLKRLYAPIASLGVDHLWLCGAAKVERYYFDSHATEPALARERLIEGLVQARDTRLPRLELHRALVPALRRAEQIEGALRIALDPSYPARLGETVARANAPRVVLAIGPEGGWTTDERARLEAAGFTGASLGERPLRSDVAVIACLSIAHDALRG